LSRVSSRIVATASDGSGVKSSPFMGRRPPLETKVARTVSNVLQRSIPPCACSTKSKSAVMGPLPICARASVLVLRNRTRGRPQRQSPRDPTLTNLAADGAALSDRVLDDICLIGPLSRCCEQLAPFRVAGTDLPILMPPYDVDGARAA